MSGNNVELEVLKINRYKGKPISMSFRIRCTIASARYLNISPTWTEGIIRLDMTRIFSAVFQEWHKLSYDEEEKLYKFNRSKVDKNYSVVEELAAAVDKFNTEHL